MEASALAPSFTFSGCAMINIETPTYYTATKKYNLSFP